MNLVVCPHCNSHRIVTQEVPKEVVVVMQCPSCNELVVLFRQKVIALDRNVLEQGTQEDRKAHLASVIAEFLDPSLFKFTKEGSDNSAQFDFSTELPAVEETPKPASPKKAKWSTPISDREYERFTRFQLKRLDNPEYFRRHFA